MWLRERKVEGYLPFPTAMAFSRSAHSVLRAAVEHRPGKPDTIGAIDFGSAADAPAVSSQLSIGTPANWKRKSNGTRGLLVALADEQAAALGYLAYVAANCNTALRSLPYVRWEANRHRGTLVRRQMVDVRLVFRRSFCRRLLGDPGIVFDETNRNIQLLEPWYIGWQEGVHRKPGVPTDENPRDRTVQNDLTNTTVARCSNSNRSSVRGRSSSRAAAKMFRGTGER